MSVYTRSYNPPPAPQKLKSAYQGGSAIQSMGNATSSAGQFGSTFANPQFAGGFGASYSYGFVPKGSTVSGSQNLALSGGVQTASGSEDSASAPDGGSNLNTNGGVSAQGNAQARLSQKSYARETPFGTVYYNTQNGFGLAKPGGAYTVNGNQNFNYAA